ncbi:hydroxymethylglutaryl-CoA synthase family protein [Trichomonas vaginalis G3]|uniref:Hydroxymethylglutaryl-CoA synthase n=1 Tax=Trichomonas vaginalis (strain ATCC PRA-98 / G3) TaxID=412133 RepID=A2F2P2_TRIV3|nr:hydroxymethylglutaryl-CoA synthase protein [Trichomonas vaginalis G3]EAY00816.1 hydroxymethylglutaryl-CoA synthase family protein [Trichomonas vaginalis G3]KAI5492104.1 hydroxymethylglutaryl-CoA synthase protein [Trichomonas vaginalis G3]|eukprot:XP_001313745.1 hydroxymethylglutaryl-CoA synthase family protein [Trichomonas vaginalis G3]
MSTPQNIGIKAIQVYIPKSYVTQDDLEDAEISILGEEFRTKIKGKYTKGLGQTTLSFCTDHEDTASIAMSAVQKLFDTYGYKPTDFGRLEVGSETSIDRSKSIKSFIMQLFEENHSILGVDNTNACYGGTAAFLNSLAWIESSQWDGRLALVVCSDIAVYDDRVARPTGGCGSVAIVLGPDAPIVFEKGSLTNYFINSYDFCKPNPSNPHPIVDGPLSLIMYYECLENCYMQLRSRHPGTTLDKFDFIVLHTPFQNHIKKCTGRLNFLDQHQDNNDPEIIKTRTEHQTVSQQSQAAANIFKGKVHPASLLSEMCGNGYTASLYMALASLIFNQDLIGKRLLMFSFGSGSASSMYALNVVGDTKFMKDALNLQERLDNRVQRKVSDYDNDVKLADKRYLTAPYEPEDSLDLIEKGSWYLEKIDDNWKRIYRIKE